MFFLFVPHWLIALCLRLQYYLCKIGNGFFVLSLMISARDNYLIYKRNSEENSIPNGPKYIFLFYFFPLGEIWR